MIVGAGPVRAATFSASSVAELISAINVANQNVDPDSINLAPGVTFTLTIPENETNGPTGLPTIAAGGELSIFGNGAVIERSAATETPTFRLFDVAAGAALRLENLTLQGGHLYGSPVLTSEASAKGGAIFNQGDLDLHNVTVQDNMAVGLIGYYARGYSAAGGGIYSSGSLTMQGGAIQNNLAQGGLGGHALVGRDGASPGGPGGHGWGGGLYVADGTATLNDVTLSANAVQGGAGGRGATIRYRGQIIATRGGRGGDASGGGLSVADGAITLYDAAVTNNVAVAGAGGTGGSGPPPGAHGAAGLARGGGVYIEIESVTRLDELTFTRVTNNTPSNFYGPFEVVPNRSSGDFNADGAIDSDDLTMWQTALGTTGDADADHDGDSDGGDFLAWQRQLGSGLPEILVSTAVPEPGSAGLMVILLLVARFATTRARC
jgi:hypothetical protein